jgi:hypothetical protein
MRVFVAAAVMTIAGLIVVHGTIPEHFLVDSTTVALLVLLAAVAALPFLPLVRRYISELTVMGTTIKFREEVERAEELADTVALEAEQKASALQHKLEGGDRRRAPKAVSPKWPRFVHIGQHLYRLIDEDPKLAVAGLGIEIERVLRGATSRAGLADETRALPLPRAINLLREKGLIDRSQQTLLRQLLDLRKLAVHGQQISAEDAYKFFSVVERLNDSVALGFSIDFSPNEQWVEQGLICQYEHCIEHMPLRQERGNGSCPVFGHDCPGGVAQVQTCKSEGRSADDPLGTRETE